VHSRPLVNRIALPLAVLTFYFLVPVSANDAPVGALLGVMVGVVSLVAVTATVVSEVRRSEKRLKPIHLLVAFELVLVIFAFGYYVVAIQHPGEFEGLHTRLDALYFSMATMSTVGYGDIHAAGQLSRLLVTVQMVFNLIFVATLVGLFQNRLRRQGAA